MNYHALCFVDMPFGQKPDLKSGVVVDFDQIYNEAIKPAIEACGLEALRGDEERTGGIIHGAMFARLLLAEFVVADLTLANPNVFYELGIRHAAKPFTTVPIFANVSAMPFDVALVRAVGYELKKGKLTKAAAKNLKSQLSKRLCDAISGAAIHDSPLFQLIPKFPGIDLPEEVTEAFKDRIRQAEEFREILSSARAQSGREGREALLKIRRELGDLKTVQRAVLIELMSSFRDAEAFDELVELYNSFPAPVKEYVIVRQQFALALNRRNQSDDREKALKILDELLENRGPDPETLGIKGRIHKDIYKEAARAGRITAAAALDDAIDAYTKGFEADPRDYYPGVNAINLLMQKDDTEALKEVARLLPLVSFAVERRGGASSSNYWDLATVLELACIGDDWATANRVLPKAILAAINSFETATTLGNLRLLKRARERTAREVAKLDGILNEFSVRDIELRGEEKNAVRRTEIMRKNTITFDNGNHAVVVIAGRDTDAQTILKPLGIAQPHALIMVFGGAKGLEDSQKARLAELFTSAVAPAAAEAGALVIDGGTQFGVMAMMGEALARDGRDSQLLGIAPIGKVTYPGSPNDANIGGGAPLEPNHSHFVLVESDEWGDETGTMFKLARALNVAVATMLINGGPIAEDEALRSVRNGWPLLVVEGSGRFADELSVAIRDGQSSKSTIVSEIACSGRVTIFHVDDSAEKLRNSLRRMLGG